MRKEEKRQVFQKLESLKDDDMQLFIFPQLLKVG
jgi:hypothetical protein